MSDDNTLTPAEAIKLADEIYQRQKKEQAEHRAAELEYERVTRYQPVGFTLVIYIQILADGSHHDGHRIFTDGTTELEQWKNDDDLKFFDFDEHHYSFVNGEWVED